jgi:hypothetical protein
MRSSEKDFETLQLGAFATPGLFLAQEPEGLTAESGMRARPERWASHVLSLATDRYSVIGFLLQLSRTGQNAVDIRKHDLCF